MKSYARSWWPRIFSRISVMEAAAVLLALCHTDSVFARTGAWDASSNIHSAFRRLCELPHARRDGDGTSRSLELASALGFEWADFRFEAQTEAWTSRCS